MTEQNKRPLALTFARQLAERQLDDAITGGQVEKRALELALERGGRTQEYLVEAQEEFEQRYFGPVVELEEQEKDSREFEERQAMRQEARELDVPLYEPTPADAEDKDLDRRAWAYAQKHGVTYTEALTKLLDEEGA